MHTIIEIIKSNQLFLNIKEEEIIKILSCSDSKVVEYEDNQIVFQKDDILNKLGIILEGKFNLISQKYNGSRVIVTTLEQNDLFAEALIFSSNKSAPYDLISSGNSKAIFIPNSIFFEMCKDACSFHKILISNMLNILSDKIVVLNKKMNILNADSLKERIALYLLYLYKKTNSLIVEMPLKRQELADFLNVKRPSLSRELSNMQHDKIIDVCRSTVKILDINKLMELTD